MKKMRKQESKKQLCKQRLSAVESLSKQFLDEKMSEKNDSHCFFIHQIADA